MWNEGITPFTRPLSYQTETVEVPGGGKTDAADFVGLRCRECGLIFCWGHAEVHYEGDPEMAVAKLPCGHWRVVDG